MNLTEYQQTFTPIIEQGLRSFLDAQKGNLGSPIKEMLAYHMGWRDDKGQGKRLRPLITLLCTEALGGQRTDALPAALAVEFLHNFSLVHDDIEDRSLLRHGRETLWMRWGEAQAINAGDALFSIAQLALLDLAHVVNPRSAVEASLLFNQTCLSLTRGQQLDIAFETAQDTTIVSYLEMIQGKTGSLIAYAAAVAAIITQKTHQERALLNAFGKNLGLAFQVQDDILGIWGDSEITGKSSESDLMARKKTLPVLFGLQNCVEFRNLWAEDEITPEQVERMASLLESCGAREFASQKAQEYTGDAFKALETLFPNAYQGNEPAEALFALSERLLGRNF